MYDWPRLFAEWRDLYGLLGTAAATLLGLTFVVITLSPWSISERPEAVRGFTTPIVGFFGTVLVLSVCMMHPHLGANLAALTFLVLGVLGTGYLCTTGTYRQWRENELGFDDLLWYIVLPGAAYVAMVIVAIGLWMQKPFVLEIAAASSLVLLIVGIRNAWDIVLTVARHSTERNKE